MSTEQEKLQQRDLREESAAPNQRTPGEPASEAELQMAEQEAGLDPVPPHATGTPLVDEKAAVTDRPPGPVVGQLAGWILLAAVIVVIGVFSGIYFWD